MAKNIRKQFTRRGVLAAAAASAGIGAAGLKALNGSPPARGPVVGLQRPWWVTAVDHPTLGETNDDFGRFIGPNMFGLYRQLKDERDGAGASEKQAKARQARITEYARRRKPGFDLRDRQLAEASWTLMRSAVPGEGLLAWTRRGVRTPQELGVGRYTALPPEAANTVKIAARLFGAGLAGIAPMNEKYVNRKEGAREIAFADVDVPAVTPTQWVIPRKMRWVVALAIPMDAALMARVPTAVGETATSLGYSQCVFVVATLAEFIRGLGYQAIPSVNDTAQSIPFAVDAGLGEMSRLNRLITPEFGAAVRLCKVFTDLPMAYDKPIDFGVVSFCRRCKLCAEVCPAGALSLDEEPSYRVRGPWNNPGHRAWFEDAYKCYQQWQEVTTPCSICFAVCPYTKSAHAWVLEVARSVPAQPPPATYPFVDGTLNWERQREPDDWWDRQT